MKLTVMSFNTQHCANFITHKIDFDAVADAIRTCGADIVGLQEIRDTGINLLEFRPQAKILGEKLGFYHYFGEAIKFAGNNPYGNALLSRFPIVSAETVPIPDPRERRFKGYYETRCVIRSKIDIGQDEPLTVCVTHFGLNPDEHIMASTTCSMLIEDRRFVIMGDFNVRPQNPVLRPFREKLFDTAEKFTEPLYSFPSDKPDRKIDYLFTSRDIEVAAADIPAIVVSDHRPYTADIII